MAFGLGFTSGLIVGDPVRREIVFSKIRGRLPHRSLLETVRFIIPAGLPGPLAHITSIHVEQKRTGVCPVQWETPFGLFWGRESERDLLVFLMQEQFFRRIYEVEPVVVREGDIVLDAGANLGTFTRYALSRGARRVIAFEPEPTNIACFKSTFKSDLETGRVVLAEAALWEQSGSLDFIKPPEGNSGMGSVARHHDLASMSVRATTIDETVVELNLNRVDFIKMDIEGAERFAIRGARHTLERFAPRLSLSIEHFPDDPEAITKAVLAARPNYHLVRGNSVLHFYQKPLP